MAKAEKLENMVYSRENPSPEYLRLKALYEELHAHGNDAKEGGKVYPGKSLWPHIGFIKALVDKYQAKTLLDYGAGKGRQYTHLCVKPLGEKIYPSIKSYWQTDIHCYDAGHKPFQQFPDSTFDGVISTDVLEHCPREDMAWILGEMFSKAEKFVFANVACYPANTILPNGENAHATVEPPDWWRGLIEGVAKAYPDIDYYLAATVDKTKEPELISNIKAPDSVPKVNALPGNMAQAYFAAIRQKIQKMF